VPPGTIEIVADPDRPIITTRRTVHAPRAMVFEAFTRPEHLRRWMGPRGLDMVVCESELRPGGRYRFVYRAPDGQELAFSGEYREVVPPSLIVRTFVFEFMPAVSALERLELEEHDGRTTIKTITVHQTMANRDGHLEHGMEQGMTEGYERLDALLVELGG